MANTKRVTSKVTNSTRSRRWGVALRKNITVKKGANTKVGRYPLTSFKTFRKASTRAEARMLKANDGRDVVIVDTHKSYAVR